MPSPLAWGYRTSFVQGKLVFVVAVAIGFWILCVPVRLQAQAPPSADSFVSSATPKVNYGSGISLVVGPHTNAFVQFNLSGVPTGATISKATLRLYVDAVVSGGSFDVYQINNAWGEHTLTYNNAPLLGASATGSHAVTVSSASCNQFLLIDVTALVRAWASGTTPNNGVALALTSGSNGNFSFDSKESLLTGNGPELEIALGGSGVAGPQGPAGPQGASGLTGPQGPQGPTGPLGPAGPQGATGAIGPIGLMGVPGATGPQGPSGTSGYADFSCPSGQSVTGFNAASQPVCGATSSGGGGGGTQDADGDGIPDALDPCPAAANVTFNGTSYCPGTIYDIATGLLNPGYAVKLSNVQVVSVSATQITIEIMPGDVAYTGPDHSSIIVPLGSVPPPGLGNRINAYGVVTQGQGFSLAALEILSTAIPAPTLSSITPQFTTVQVGSQVTLTVNMTAPVTGDTTVTFVSSDATAALVSAPATIPMGQSSATFTVTGVAQASSVTIEALLNGAEVTSHVQVVP